MVKSTNRSRNGSDLCVRQPENQKVGCVIGLGYPDEEPAAPKRKSVEELLTYHN